MEELKIIAATLITVLVGYYMGRKSVQISPGDGKEVRSELGPARRLFAAASGRFFSIKERVKPKAHGDEDAWRAEQEAKK